MRYSVLLAMACFMLPCAAFAQILLIDGSDLDMTGSAGSQIIFPDGSVQSTAAGADPIAGHGGANNVVSGTLSFVGGGQANTASGDFSVVNGGRRNVASALFTTIGGGGYSTADLANTATDRWATVGGGQFNRAGNGSGTDFDANFATIAGGAFNKAGGRAATVAGGEANTITDDWGTIAGGYQNQAGDAAGTQFDALYTTVGGGQGNLATGSGSTIGGGGSNAASGTAATVAGGGSGQATGNYSTVGGGYSNDATGNRSVVSGGNANVASQGGTTVGGGYGNSAAANSATVGGGAYNDALGNFSTVGGGSGNTASGYGATIPGGVNSVAHGDYSFAAGRKAAISSDHDGAFVFADGTDATFNSAAANEFAVRASGGVRFVTDSDPANVGVKLDSGDTAWETLSARASKENFTEVDAVGLLETLENLPIARWNYTHQDMSIQHIGPMAEDFHTAFGLDGEFDGAISTLDFDGVALAAIQGVNRKLETELAERDRELAAMRAFAAAESARSRERIDALMLRLTALESRIRSTP